MSSWTQEPIIWSIPGYAVSDWGAVNDRVPALGKEVVQLYVSRKDAKFVRLVKELRAFEKIAPQTKTWVGDLRYGKKGGLNGPLFYYVGIGSSGRLSAADGGLITEITWKAGKSVVICERQDRRYQMKLLRFVLIQAYSKNCGHYIEMSVHGINRTLFVFVSIYTIYP